MIGNDPENFQTVIPGRVLVVSKSDIQYLPEIIISVMQLSKGKDKKTVLSQWGDLARSVVNNAISLISIKNNREIKF